MRLRTPQNPDRSTGQHPAAPPGAPCGILVVSAPSPTPCQFKCKVGLGRAWSRRQYSPVPGVRVGFQCKGPVLGGWLGAQGQGIIVCGPRAIERPPYPCSNLL